MKSVTLYLLNTAALMVLLAITIGIAFIDLGSWNMVITLLVAMLKAGLIIWIFMHIRGSSSLVRFAMAAGFFWLGILIALTLADYLTRG